MSNKVSSITALLNKTKSQSLSSDQELIHKIDLSAIEFDNEQPRQEILEEEVLDIVRTLDLDNGKINQPVTVWPKNKDGKFILRLGEKRVRASILAGKKTIPAIIEVKLKFDNEEDRKTNYLEQYIENDSRSSLTALDDCVALAKIYNNLGSLQKVIDFKGKGSAGTISDKIKVSRLKTDDKFNYLFDYYKSENCKVKDLTTYRILIEVLDVNEEYFDLIIDKVKKAIEQGRFNRQYVKLLASENFHIDEEEEPEKEEIAEERKDNFKVVPYKKVCLSGVVTINRKKHTCKVIINRKDSEDDYIWVLLDGDEEPSRVSISTFSLTGLNNAG